MSTESSIIIPEGRPQSGRVWKAKQTSRFSSIKRAGLLKNQSKTYEERQIERQQKAKVLELEREMREESKQKRAADIERILEKRKRVAEGEKKNAVYQQVNKYTTLYYTILSLPVTYHY